MKGNRNKWLLLVLSMLLVFSVVLTACGGKESTTGETKTEPGTDGQKQEENQEEQPAIEQVLRLTISDEPLLDPQRSQYNFEFLVINGVMEGLLRLDQESKPAAGIAEKWEASEDGMVWTFNLRDAKWSDDTAVTAHDFVYAWERAVNPDIGSIYASIVSDHIKTAEALDEKTLKVELANPTPYFESLMSFQTFFPAKKEFVEANGEGYGTEPDKLLYNGPFKLTQWEHNNRLILEKNENYWDADTVKLTKVTLDIVKDGNADLALYEEGSIDRVGLAREQVPMFKDHAEYNTISEPVVFYMMLNTKTDVLANSNIRKALSYGFDRQAYTDVILNNGSVPAHGLIPDNVPGPEGAKDFRSVNGDLVTYDPEKAKEFLDAGLKELGLEKLPPLRYLSTDSTTGIKGSEFVKENYTKLGIDIAVELVPVATVKEKRQKGEFELYFGGWGPDYWDPMTFMDLWVTDGPFNEGKWSNAQYDEIIQFAKSTSDTKTRMERLLEAERILIQDEAAIVPAYYRTIAYLQKPYVKNFVMHPFGADHEWKWVEIEAH